jgi:hypothetical protein
VLDRCVDSRDLAQAWLERYLRKRELSGKEQYHVESESQGHDDGVRRLGAVI